MIYIVTRTSEYNNKVKHRAKGRGPAMYASKASTNLAGNLMESISKALHHRAGPFILV